MSKKTDQLEAEIEALRTKLKATRDAERAAQEQELVRLARVVGVDQLLAFARQKANGSPRKPKPQEPKPEASA